MNARTSLLAAAMTAAASAFAGECTYPFAWYKNNPVDDIQVPLTLLEGRNGFSYEGFADRAGGSDLRVYSGDTQLAYEIEAWNPDGASTVWVKLPRLEPAATLTLRWGDATAVKAEGCIWGEESSAVFHFPKEDQTKDSSVHAGQYASSGNEYVEDAPTACGHQFGTTSCNLKTPDGKVEQYAGLTNKFTISFWLRASGSKQGYLFNMRAQGTSSQFAILYKWSGANTLSWYSYAGTIVNGKTGNTAPSCPITLPTDMRWHHYAFTYDGSAMSGYLDGELKKTWTQAMSLIPWNLSKGYVSISGSSPTSDSPDCAMDELRFESVGRSADWVRAQCESQAQMVANRGADVAFVEYDGQSTLTNFPAYVTIDGNVSDGLGADPQLLGDLLSRKARVMSETGAELEYELDYVISNAAHRSAGLWVKVPEFTSASAVSVCRADCGYYYPNKPASAAKDFNIWTNDPYFAVWHLAGHQTARQIDSVAGREAVIRSGDSGSSSEWTGAQGAMDGPTGPYQAMRKGPSLARVCEAANEGPTALENVFTLSWWMKNDKYDDPNAQAYYLDAFGTAVIAGSGYASHGAGANKLCLWPSTSVSQACALTIPDAGWHHYAYACDGQTLRGYVDGVKVKEETGAYSISQTQSEIWLGNARSGRSKNGEYGGLDEVRLERICRGDDWIRACFRNQNVRRDGVFRVNAPHFAQASFGFGNANSATFTAKLSCREPSKVTLYYGETDGGTEPIGWQHAVSFGFMDEVEITRTLTGLDPDTPVFARFRASNVHGTAWSEPMYARAAVKVAGQWNLISVNYDGDAVLTNFPLCVRIPAGAELPAATNAVRFVDCETGAMLPFDTECWNPQGTSVFWVRVPELKRGTSFRMLKSRLGQNLTAWTGRSVWDSDYKRVYHFADSPVDPTADEFDSSVYAERLKMSSDLNRLYSSRSPDGAIGPCRYFPGHSENTKEAGNFKGPTDLPLNDFGNGCTFSFWLKVHDKTTQQVPLQAATTGFIYRFYVESGYLDFQLWYSLIVDGTTQDASGSYFKSNKVGIPSVDAWHHYALVHSGTNVVLYVDGEPGCAKPHALQLAGIKYGNQMCHTSFGNAVNEHNWLTNGSIDEYRVTTVPRSAAWLAAEYANQRPDSTFVTVGPTEQNGVLLFVR